MRGKKKSAAIIEEHLKMKREKEKRKRVGMLTTCRGPSYRLLCVVIDYFHTHGIGNEKEKKKCLTKFFVQKN